jgi:hypothetical protein
VRIPMPTNPKSWRIVFYCSADGARQDFDDWANRRATGNICLNLSGDASQYRFGRRAASLEVKL